MAMAAHAAEQAGQLGVLDEHTERLLQVATCMAMSKYGEAVSGLTSMARAFYGDAVLWAVHKGHRGPQGRTRLMYAAKVGNLARVRFLLQRGAAAGDGDAHDGRTALMWASSNGHLDVVRFLVDHGGASVNASRPHDGMTALMWACYEDHENIGTLNPLDFAHECQLDHLQIARFLVERGASVDAATTDDGMTALMFACLFGHLRVVRCLVEIGANVNALRSDDGLTALMIACQNGHVKIAGFLMEHGADPQLQDHGGRTALSFALGNPMLQALLQR